MVGMDRFTGKAIEEPAHVRQSIDVILTTPLMTRIMRPEFGFACIEKNCHGKLNVSEYEVVTKARETLTKYEPRITVGKLKPEFDAERRLVSLSVDYMLNSTGLSSSIKVLFPPAHVAEREQQSS